MSIAENLAEVRQRIAEAAQRSGRTAEAITLVAVSKTWPGECVAEAFEAGQVHFGENRVQELCEKAPLLPSELCWHLIGHLQKNKIRKALPHCQQIQSVDSVALAQRLDRITGELTTSGDKLPVLLQVNISDDEAKFGFSPEELSADCDALADLKNLKIEGLMTVPRYDPDPEKTRPHFAALRELQDTINSKIGGTLSQLSMGMSHDFEVAVEEGATIARVGSSIFGRR